MNDNLNNSSEKLQKVLAHQGIASRRVSEQWIADGRVSVNGKIAKLGDRVAESDLIRVDGKPLNKANHQVKSKVILYHKPVGELCTRKDPQGRRTVYENLPSLKQGRWIGVGRLDINTCGLMLFTNDGELANRLMHPSNEVEREYAVRVFGKVSEHQIKQLLKGVQLKDGEAKFESIKPGGGEGQNHWYHVVLKEGRNREVRRLWESQDVKVSRLIRVRYANIRLDKSQKSGRWEYLDDEAVRQLFNLVNLKQSTN